MCGFSNAACVCYSKCIVYCCLIHLTVFAFWKMKAIWQKNATLLLICNRYRLRIVYPIIRSKLGQFFVKISSAYKNDFLQEKPAIHFTRTHVRHFLYKTHKRWFESSNWIFCAEFESKFDMPKDRKIDGLGRHFYVLFLPIFEFILCDSIQIAISSEKLDACFIIFSHKFHSRFLHDKLCSEL